MSTGMISFGGVVVVLLALGLNRRGLSDEGL